MEDRLGKKLGGNFDLMYKIDVHVTFHVRGMKHSFVHLYKFVMVGA